jgi:NADH-quinone oxidoreductase subunit H
MGVTLFLGGWQAPLAVLEFIPSYVWFGMKLLLLLLGFIWIRATFPRLRIDQLTRLSWKFLVPLALVNLVNGGLWAVTSDWTGAAGVARWVVSALLVVVPFVVLGRSLTAGYGPRTYRYASP